MLKPAVWQRANERNQRNKDYRKYRHSDSVVMSWYVRKSQESSMSETRQRQGSLLSLVTDQATPPSGVRSTVSTH